MHKFGPLLYENTKYAKLILACRSYNDRVWGVDVGFFDGGQIHGPAVEGIS